MIRLLRRLREGVTDFCGPLVWALSMVPDLLLRTITAAAAGVIVVFVFGAGIVATESYRRHYERPIVAISAIPPEKSD